MSCAFEEDLTAYLDGELPPARRQELERHLPGCASCGPTLAILRKHMPQLAALPAFEPSPQLRRAVMNALDDEPPGLFARLSAFFRPAVLVPSLGLAAALGVALFLARPEAPLDVADANQLELAANMEVVEDLEVLGMDNPSDLEVIEHLHEIEVTP